MNWVFDMNLSASDIIAIFALLVAGLAALYARWSSIEAKKANQISLISGRKEIYIAFIDLKMHMLQNQQSAQLAEVSKFYYHTITACLFFQSSLAKDIQDYYDACFWIADIYRSDGRITLQNSREDQEKYLKAEKDLSSKIDRKILKIFKDMNIEPKCKII
jgi:hypothetical protein